MIPVKQAAQEFLAQHRIAVTGVSRTPEDHGANEVYRRLKERGYAAFAVNPNAGEVEGDPAYWRRPWRIDYAGGGFRLHPLPPVSSVQAPVQAEPVQVVAWDPSRVVSSPADGGILYGR